MQIGSMVVIWVFSILVLNVVLALLDMNLGFCTKKLADINFQNYHHLGVLFLPVNIG
jgi:hypothetical protein